MPFWMLSLVHLSPAFILPIGSRELHSIPVEPPESGLPRSAARLNCLRCSSGCSFPGARLARLCGEQQCFNLSAEMELLTRCRREDLEVSARSNCLLSFSLSPRQHWKKIIRECFKAKLINGQSHSPDTCSPWIPLCQNWSAQRQGETGSSRVHRQVLDLT